MPCGWGVKAGTVWFVCEWQVKLCDPLITHESYLSALRWWYTTIKRYINTRFFTLLYILLLGMLKVLAVNTAGHPWRREIARNRLDLL